MSELFTNSSPQMNDMTEMLRLEHPVLTIVNSVDHGMYRWVMSSLMFLRARGSPSLKVYIDSPGGDVQAGLDIYDAIRLYPGDTEAVVHREAMSMGAVILQACKVRTCAKHASVLIHYVARGNVSLSELKSAKKLRELIESLETRQRRLDAIFAERTKKSISHIRRVCQRDKPMTSEDALKFGLIDKII